MQVAPLCIRQLMKIKLTVTRRTTHHWSMPKSVHIGCKWSSSILYHTWLRCERTHLRTSPWAVVFIITATSTITICYYYSTRKLIPILPSLGGWKADESIYALQ